MSLQYYEDKFKELKTARSGASARPYKMCMLLAVIDLVEQGVITENKIIFDDALKSAFTKQFDLFIQNDDGNTPHRPFYFLRSSEFWYHKVREGKQAIYDSIENSNSGKKLADAIDYAFIDKELFEYFQSSVARECLKNALAENFDLNLRERLLNPTKGWSWQECELIVADYFQMLENELRGEKYNKSEHNRKLQDLLKNRSKGSIEKKHQNISAILNEIGAPIIDGYKPLSNYQKNILPDIIGAVVASNQSIEQIIHSNIIRDTDIPAISNILDSLVEAPESRLIEDTSRAYPAGSYVPKKRDYLAQAKRNQNLGLAGEKFIINFEKAHLVAKGKDNLAEQVEHISLDDDSKGFDIKSYEENGRDRLIEVKTTRYDRYSQFYVSPNELNTSKMYEKQYHLYRLFTFDKHPRFFVRRGDIEKNFKIKPSAYLAVNG